MKEKKAKRTKLKTVKVKKPSANVEKTEPKNETGFVFEHDRYIDFQAELDAVLRYKPPTPEAKAKHIIQLHDLEQGIHEFFTAPIRIRQGELLREIRNNCNHGDWLKKLKSLNLPYTVKTAQNYMKVAHEVQCLGNKALAMKMPITKLYHQFGLIKDKEDKEKELRQKHLDERPDWDKLRDGFNKWNRKMLDMEDAIMEGTDYLIEHAVKKFEEWPEHQQKTHLELLVLNLESIATVANEQMDLLKQAAKEKLGMTLNAENVKDPNKKQWTKPRTRRVKKLKQKHEQAENDQQDKRVKAKECMIDA